MENVRPCYVAFELLTLHDDYVSAEEVDGLLAYKATADPDTMYLYEALKRGGIHCPFGIHEICPTTNVHRGGDALLRHQTSGWNSKGLLQGF